MKLRVIFEDGGCTLTLDPETPAEERLLGAFKHEGTVEVDVVYIGHPSYGKVQRVALRQRVTP